MTNTIKARFAIRTQNVRDNKHLAAIHEVLAGSECNCTSQYVHRKNSGDVIGMAIYGTFPADVVERVNALPIPDSAKIKGTDGWSA